MATHRVSLHHIRLHKKHHYGTGLGCLYSACLWGWGGVVSLSIFGVRTFYQIKGLHFRARYEPTPFHEQVVGVL